VRKIGRLQNMEINKKDARKRRKKGEKIKKDGKKE
jgi:hypothetical protein